MRIAAAGAAALLGVSLLAGCASAPAEPTAEQKVCDSRAQLSKDYQTLVDDLKAANFGDAKKQLAVLKTDVETLATNVSALAEDKKAEVQPQVDALKATLQGLSSVTSLADLQSQLDTAKTQFTSIVDQLKTTANCTS